MVILKLTSIVGAISAFYAIFVYGPLFADWRFQALLLGGFFILNSIRFSIGNSWAAFRFLLPFCFFLLAFGYGFDLIGLYGRRDWLYDSFRKTLVFPNSFFIIKILISCIDYRDITRLPASISTRIFILALKSCCEKGGEKLDRFKWFIQNDPVIRKPAGRWVPPAVERYSILLLALYLYLDRETRVLIDVTQNRFHHFDIETERK